MIAKQVAVQAELTQRQITLIRVALMARCSRLKSLIEKKGRSGDADLLASYVESGELLKMLHQLRLGMRDMAIEEVELEKRHGENHQSTA